ncbi:pyridine nucleotide-disulfide oxidoreductase [Flavobacterium faecale]|uniref:Pyridine nucleotide-disulfide oxidoreductase n=1 Tax=Flavobacterium faecale TaxID=1355330 RepID=A0A2S1LDR9_9FLAO|nr:FAD-dependent oxidoreductase [Flavobacterium faecale]AWG21905.1 pyridine nucleotide-disulfide oxidoreductase [Flavobacterium faecale]
MTQKIKMYGAEWCPDCRRTKGFFTQNNIEFEYINLDITPDASKLVEEYNNGKRIIPTVVIHETAHSNPQNHELAAILGINKQGTVKLYGADWCPDCRRAKRFLQDNQINFEFIDVENTEGASEYVMKVNNGKRIIPTILINDTPYSNPDNNKLTELLHIDKVTDTRIYDVLIVGGGASGLTTAIYAQRDRFDSIILEKKNIGGNAFITKKIENYPGFKEVSGPDLMDRMEQQAATLGAKIETGVEIVSIERVGNFFKVYTKSEEYRAKSIVISTGSTYRTLGIPGEAELIGSGIHYCATCDGAFYRDKEVIVIGGGNSALEEGMFLAGFCKKVTIIHRGEKFSADEIYTEKLTSFENIEVHLNKKPKEFIADSDGNFDKLIYSDNETEKEGELTADGVFTFIGLIPNTKPFEGFLNLSNSGHILTKNLNQTSVEGIFAAGDCRFGAIAQVAAATGEGVVASYGLKEYLKK